MQNALLVVAKQPVAGSVKTRLGDLFSPELKAEFYRCLMLDTLALAARVPDVDRGVLFTPDDAAGYFRALAPGFQLHPQRGLDLGSRLLHAFEDYLGRGYTRVVIMDSDSPTLPVDCLARAFARLEDSDIVLGPCEDGGYYLVGARAPHPELFLGMQMSTPHVFAETQARAEAAGLKLAVLPTWYDVDLASDVERLRAELFRDGLETRHTAEFFRRLDHSQRGPCRQIVLRMPAGGNVTMDDDLSKWDAGAAAYSTYLVSPAGSFRTTLIWDTLLRHLPPPPLHVIEVGCGPGHLACALAQRGDSLVATDPSPEMLRQAADRASALPASARSRLDLRLFDVTRVLDECPPDGFDCLIVHTVLEYLPDSAATFARLLTLLSPGGLVSLVQINRASRVLRAVLSQRDFAAALSALDEATVRSDTFGLPAQATTLAEMWDLFRRNGLDVVGSYGIRIFPDYLPAEAKTDPAQAEGLLRLERAVCGLDPYRAIGRYLHVVGRKGAAAIAGAIS